MGLRDPNVPGGRSGPVFPRVLADVRPGVPGQRHHVRRVRNSVESVRPMEGRGHGCGVRRIRKVQRVQVNVNGATLSENIGARNGKEFRDFFFFNFDFRYSYYTKYPVKDVFGIVFLR